MGFVIITDTAARIISVSHTSLEFENILSPGQDLFVLLEKGSREKFTRFLQTIWQDGQANAWEMFIECGGEAQYLIFIGNRFEDTLCIAAAENPEELHALAKDHCSRTNFSAGNPSQTTDSQKADTTTNRPDQKLFDDIGVLYGEMATLQRELSKKQVELEQSNKIINDYAANLEQMVAEKTQELAASEAKFRGIFENSSLGIAITGITGNIITCNDALIKIIGLSKDKICQYSIADIFFKSDPHSFSNTMERFRQDSNSAEEIEIQFSQTGSSDRWVNINIYALDLHNTDQKNIIFIIENITQRKLNERALLQSEKLAAVGKLSASLAHEINNPLQSIIGYLGLASETLNADNPIGEYLNIAAQELDRIKNIVADLRSASRKPQIKEKKPADLSHVIQRVINLTRKKAGEKHINLNHDPENDLPLVLMDSEQIHQVLLNLVINSIEAIGENGEVLLSCNPTADGKMMKIIVADDGSGIKPEIISNLFQPFFTTKKEGLGLGLHLSKAIIDAHNGELSAENRSKGGAVFTIMLPIA